MSDTAHAAAPLVFLALVACLASPAQACTDWKAVAAFDAIIAANDKIAVADEDSRQNDPMCVQFRNGKIEFGDPVKWPKGSPAYRTAEAICSGATSQAGTNAADVVGHRDAALADACEQGKK